MMIPACFTQPNTLSSSNTPPNPQSQSHQNHQLPHSLITSIYQTQLCNSPTYLTLTWSKTLYSHSLIIQSPDSFSITISLYPSTFSLFRNNKPGSKSISLTQTHQNYNQRLKLYWDFTHAQFTHNSAEPQSSFYIAIVCNARLEFFLGDLQTELSRRSGGGLILTKQVSEPAMVLSRREHVFGKKSYISRAEFSGTKHEIGIECNGGALIVKVDGEISLVVKRLAWKFRGNERIFVGGIEVEFFWDVFNWVNSNNYGHGVFIFQVGDGGVWPEIVGPEKRLMRKSMSCSSAAASPGAGALSVSSASPSCSSVLQWAEESSHDSCGGSRRSSCSSARSYGSQGGFSLLLYAWRKE